MTTLGNQTTFLLRASKNYEASYFEPAHSENGQQKYLERFKNPRQILLAEVHKKCDKLRFSGLICQNKKNPNQQPDWYLHPIEVQRPIHTIGMD